MNERSFSAAHVSELERLARSSADDPVLGPQDRARLERVRAAGPADATDPGHPRAAFFLRGEAVDGTRGVDAVLAGQALTQAGKMFTEQAILQERETAEGARRPRGAQRPVMLFTGTPRASFGFELSPNAEDAALREVHATALDRLLNTILRISSDDAEDDLLEEIPRSVLPHLKLFFKTLADHHAEVRLVDTSGHRSGVTRASVIATAARLTRQVEEHEYDLPCTFRGLTMETRQFDLLADDEVVTGQISGDLTEEDVRRISGYLNQPGVATLVRTRIVHAGRAPVVSYLLTGARLEREDAAGATPGPEAGVPTA